ncbi:MAG: MFS transporter [Candidatus Aenigmarchaeota archaeon]|nr:MFS transporter [Candidatus Aenigmarchaeota archaeon]
MCDSQQRNYRIFIAVNSILGFAMGLFAPFWFLFIERVGGSIESFGFAIGLMTIASALASYAVGRLSDVHGRKRFLIVSGLLEALIIVCYTFITTTVQLYVLQIIYGLVSAMQMTMETAYLGDITKKVQRGADIGLYHAAIGLCAGVAAMLGGVGVGMFGYHIIFYVTAALIGGSTLVLFLLKE